MPAVTATGLAKLIDCQPDADSPEKATDAKRTPALDHKLPVCAPVFVAPLKNRTPVTRPSREARKRIPSSTAELSGSAATAGTA